MALTNFPDGVTSFGEPVIQYVARTVTPAVMVNGATIFTVTGGPIRIITLFSVCQVANDATASTLQYSVTPTVGTATTISGASTTLASVAAGTVVSIGSALATGAAISTTGVGLLPASLAIVPPGTIKLVIGVGSTTGTWLHYLRYEPLATGTGVS